MAAPVDMTAASSAPNTSPVMPGGRMSRIRLVKETLVIPDVDAFPGHIACSSLSRSEIVVPLMKEGEVWGVLDIDSELLGMFDEIDKEYLEQLCGYL